MTQGTTSTMPDGIARSDSVTPLAVVLALVACASTGTGIFWNAISFVAKHGYGFSQTRNLVLYLVMGATYVLVAFRSGDMLRRTERVLSPRSVLAVALMLQSAVCVLPVAIDAEWALWVAVVVTSVTSAIIWPVIESYVASGRHGPAMRRAIGWFNLTWMIAVMVPLFLLPPILERHAIWAVGGFAVINAVALPLLLGFRRAPDHHDRDVASQHIPDEYRLLLISARTLLPVSYLLNAALAPILPYRFEALGAAVTVETPITAIWMATRVILLVVMWRYPFWHGRWSVLAAGALAMAGGYALTVLAPSLGWMAVGLAGFGLGLGSIYHLALYYGMAVDRAGVDAGGTHEGLIGLGYTAGPAAGLVGAALGGPVTIVGVTLVVTALGCSAAAVPYLRRRRVQSPA